MSFIHADFLLQNKAAQRLYHDHAEDQPILDFHTHLPADDIAEDRRFANLVDLWLNGDHYKWRAMRANGVAERFCSGDAPGYEKFVAWASTVPHTLRNPLFHWTHLELKRYFGIDDLLNPGTAPEIWKRGNALLAEDDRLTAQGILKRFEVRAVCTTDDPCDSLAAHSRLAASDFEIRVLPTFRPDQALGVHNAETFNHWVDRLSAAANVDIRSLNDFLDALQQRHEYFHRAGCRLSDHGLNHCYADFCSHAVAEGIFKQLRSGQSANDRQHSQFASFMMLFFGSLDKAKDWTKQLHLGAQRNVNQRALKELGADTGFDSMGDWPQAAALGTYLDRLQQDNALPRVILYNLNPSDNYTFATMASNFHHGEQAATIQLGSAWWFLDQKEGIEQQLNTLSNTGLLSRFVGMITDSRSFMSYPRHEYFRRILCNLVGQDMEEGLIPDDASLAGKMIANICFHNAQTFLKLDLSESPAKNSAKLVSHMR